jgi:hypothetical protein
MGEHVDAPPQLRFDQTPEHRSAGLGVQAFAVDDANAEAVGLAALDQEATQGFLGGAGVHQMQVDLVLDRELAAPGFRMAADGNPARLPLRPVRAARRAAVALGAPARASSRPMGARRQSPRGTAKRLLA